MIHGVSVGGAPIRGEGAAWRLYLRIGLLVEGDAAAATTKTPTTPNNPDELCQDSLAEAAVQESREGSRCYDPRRGHRQSSRQW